MSYGMSFGADEGFQRPVRSLLAEYNNAFYTFWLRPYLTSHQSALPFYLATLLTSASPRVVTWP